MEPVEKISTKKRKDNVSVSNVMDNIMEPVDENVSTKRTRNEENDTVDKEPMENGSIKKKNDNVSVSSSDETELNSPEVIGDERSCCSKSGEMGKKSSCSSSSSSSSNTDSDSDQSADSNVDVYCHSINNESLIEHSFGFIQKKGQGNLQNMVEYVQAKRRLSNISF